MMPKRKNGANKPFRLRQRRLTRSRKLLEAVAAHATNTKKKDSIFGGRYLAFILLLQLQTVKVVVRIRHLGVFHLVLIAMQVYIYISIYVHRMMQKR